MQKSLQKIDQYIERGVEIVNRLNTFAHRMDAPMARVDAALTTDLVVFLMLRFARQKQTEIVVEPVTCAPRIRANPIRLVVAMATCINYCLECEAAGSRLRLGWANARNGAVLRVGFSLPAGMPFNHPPLPESLPFFRQMVLDLGGTFTQHTNGETTRDGVDIAPGRSQPGGPAMTARGTAAAMDFTHCKKC